MQIEFYAFYFSILMFFTLYCLFIMPRLDNYSFQISSFLVQSQIYSTPKNWLLYTSPVAETRVAMQPGEPGKVREFDIRLKNQGKVREFQYFIQNSGNIREFENFNA